MTGEESADGPDPTAAVGVHVLPRVRSRNDSSVWVALCSWSSVEVTRLQAGTGRKYRASSEAVRRMDPSFRTLPLYVSAPGLRFPDRPTTTCSGEMCRIGGDSVAERDFEEVLVAWPEVVVVAQCNVPEPRTSSELTGTNAFIGSFCLRTRLDILESTGSDGHGILLPLPHLLFDSSAAVFSSLLFNTGKQL